MKIKKTIIQTFVIGLFTCSGDVGKINDDWFGSYDMYIVYAEEIHEAEFYTPGQLIGYDVTIHRDSCTFFGLGTQTFFTYLCDVRENGDELYLLYLKIIDGFGDRFSPLDTMATLIKDGGQYYIKSPIIADTSAEFNKKLPLNKKRD